MTFVSLWCDQSRRYDAKTCGHPFLNRENFILFIQVDVDGAAKAATGLACTNWAIEGKKVGLGRCVVCSAIGAIQCAADGQVLLAIDPDIHLSATEPEPQLG